MRNEQTNEIASGAGYERLMNRMKAQTRPVVRENASFAPKKAEEEDPEGRSQFGKRRAFEL